MDPARIELGARFSIFEFVPSFFCFSLSFYFLIALCIFCTNLSVVMFRNITQLYKPPTSDNSCCETSTKTYLHIFM